jgi:hypothetical protein
VNTRSIWKRNNLTFIDKDYSPTEAASLWESCPQLAALDPAVAHVFFEDFYIIPDVTNAWVYTEIGAGGALSIPDAAGGILRLTTDALDNDSCELQKLGESWKLATGKALWFETKINLVTAAKHIQSDVLVGLCITDSTLFPGLMSDGVYFRKDDGDANFDFVTRKNAAETVTLAVGTLAAATSVKLSFFFDGAGTIYAYIAGLLVATHVLTIPDDEELTISFSFTNGEAGATAWEVDYVKVVQIR